jgi:hypothetical protein
VYFIFYSFINSMAVEKGSCNPHHQFCFFILALISASSFCSGVTVEPRYLKDFCEVDVDITGEMQVFGYGCIQGFEFCLL